MSAKSQPVTSDVFYTLAHNKRIYIFSVNLEGVGYAKLLSRQGYDVGGFIDSRDLPNGVKQGKPVIHPDRFFAKETASDVVVIITAKHRQTKRWAMDLCEQFGLRRHHSYFIATDLCDYLPTIEVAGLCNLRCISCNMGIPGANESGGLMSAATYEQILSKMQDEIPFLNSVYLYLWGEPLINPEIAEIIRITSRRGVACEISTNLINIKHLAEVVQAHPDVLVVPCSGIGENFELTRTGGKWETFQQNLYDLRRLLDLHGNTDTVVRIHYHMYKHNLQQDYDAIERLSAELGFQFLPVLAQIFPEYILRHVVYDEPIPQEMTRASDLLLYPIQDQLDYARRNASRNCFMIKVFPVVRWDGSVVQCSNLTFPTLTPNYLDTTLKVLLTERVDNKFCDTCMDHGMHRFFDVASTVKVVDGQRTVERD